MMSNRTHHMFYAVAIATVAVGILLAEGCTRRQDEPKQATEEKLSQMNRDFAKALLAGDAAAAAMLYTENASLLPPNEPIVTGRADIQQYWQELIDGGLEDVTVSTISTGSDGDLGYEIGRFRLTLRQADGTMITDEGKYAELLRLGEDGTWKSIYGMWNSDAPME